MKKALLLSALAFGFAANAQTVQNIPGNIRIDGDYTTTTVAEANIPQPDADGNVDPIKDRKKADDDGIWQSDNMQVGDKMTFKLNATPDESCYILRFQTGTKNTGSQIYFELVDSKGDLQWSETCDVYNNGQWNSKWYDAELYIADPLEGGQYTLTLTFLSDPDINGNKNTVNCREFSFEAREEIENYSLYAVCDNEDAGKIVISPFQNSYLAGTEVVLTAQANSGYKFNHWENQYGDIIEENPYTLIMTETTDMYAYFDEILMHSKVPGYVDFYTRTSGQGDPETKAVRLDGEWVNDEEPVMYLANYRHNNYEVFEIDVTKAGAYTISAPYSTKQEAGKVTFTIYDKDEYEADPTTATAEWSGVLNAENTTNWQKFVSFNFNDVNLTEGRKMLHLLFTEDVAMKYTVNLLHIGFGLGDDWGDNETEGIEGINADNAAPVKAYNLQGIEVEPTAKGLLILSNGTKVYNK